MTRPNVFWMAVAQMLLCADNENKVTKFDLRSENGRSDMAAEVYQFPLETFLLGFPGGSSQ